MAVLECAACGFGNRPGALFCGSCGAELGRRCASCGEAVAVGLAYCTSCGAALAPAAAAALTAEERKIVSVLFADIVGFTSRADRLDPEDVRGVLAPYHARLKRELEGFGGTVEKFIGDAVVALFGAPRAHEDDPERAVRAAVAVRDAVAELDAGDGSLRLNVRIGVTTGEALVNLGARPHEGEGMAAGDVVNTAARLQAAAPVNGILVDETTRRATARVIEYREHEPVHAKGKIEPVTVWEVVAPRTRLGVDIAFRGAAELVGREHELRLLLDALTRAERERAPQLVTLVGVPGIGKSRLLWELYAALSADPAIFVNWRQGRSLPYGEGVSFWALGEMVKAQAGILESDDAAAARDKLGAAVSELVSAEREAAWVEGHLRPLVGLGASGDAGAERQGEAFAAWRRFFEALAEVRPLVLVFEDVHWADEGLLDFVDGLLDWATGVPLLVVCTARPELLERRPGWGGGKRNALTVTLSPLSDEETARLLSALGSGTHEALLARAGGNPLYAEEFVRMAAERDGGRELPLPDSVQGIIAARLDTLGTDEKALLQDAAVLGKVFWVGALAAVSGLGPDAVETCLRALERKEFVRRERRSSVAGETAYVFRHVLVRDVAYGQIPRQRRGEKHRLAATWIESLTGDRVEDVADLLAHHYLSALQFARASGDAADDVSERARLALRDAGDRAFALNSFPAASRFYEAALELWPDDDGERPYLLFRYGSALHYEGRAAEALAEAATELLEAGEHEHAAEAYAVHAEAVWMQGHSRQAIEHLERAAALLAEEPPSRAKAFVLANLARFRMAADEAEEAIRVGFAALQMADELGFEELAANALNTLGVMRVGLGDRGGLVDLERAVETSLRLNSPEVVRAYNNLASTLVAVGELERGYELYGEGRRAAERFGLVAPLRWLQVEELDERYTRGEWDEAVLLAGGLLLEAGGLPHLREVDARVIRALILLARDDPAGALEDSAAALEFARRSDEPQIILPALACRARVLLETGRADDAAAQTDELVSRWRASPTSLVTGWAANLAVVAVALGRAADVLGAGQSTRLATRWLEAAVALAKGNARDAAGIYAAIGSRPDEADARLRAAGELAAGGRRGEADAELARALDFYRRVGATAYVARAEALLAPR